MGLASKLAAAQGGQPPYPGGPAGGPGQAPPQQGGYPGQQQYQAFNPNQQGPPRPGGPPGQQQSPYPGGPPGGPGGPGGPQQGPPPGQYGAPPPHQQQGGGMNVGAYKALLNACITEKGLQNFYPPGSPQLEQIANRASTQVQQLTSQWRVPQEIAADIAKIALYDVILYVDDSGSMAFEENGERIDDLKLIINRVSFATGLFDDDGIQIRFMNSTQQGNGVRSAQQVDQLISSIRFQGLTPMGRELQNKVLGPLVLGPARAGQLRKPVLVVIITDGQPTGESQKDIANIITSAARELQGNPRYGKGAVAFQFAQVGNDIKARDFLKELDENREIGDLIDCTSNYENESEEMARANPPVNLTPELWLVKLLLGSIDSSYDKQDEQTQAGPPGGGYGGPPPGQYGGPPPGQYGGPPPGQYGGPPQGGQYGGPPQGYQQQGGPGGPGGYGRPPQGPPGQGYPPQQQGGYGAPQPPRY